MLKDTPHRKTHAQTNQASTATKVILIFVAFISSSLLVGCGGSSSTPAEIHSTTQEPTKQSTKNQRLEFLLDSSLALLLQDDLWTIQNKYDSAHVLMLPMEYVFSRNSESFLKRQDFFHQHFARNFEDFTVSFGDNRLENCLYLYLVSRYLNKSYNTPGWTDAHRRAAEETVAFITEFWQTTPAWHWGKAPFTGARARLEWRLTNKVVERSYYRAIIDEELFAFGIAAEIKTLSEKIPSLRTETVDDILTYADRVFTDEIVFTEGERWTLQPGAWTDHPNYAYAGHKTLTSNLAPLPINDISPDSSHAHRYPLLLISLRDSSRPNTARFSHYNNLLMGLKQQFETVIINSPETQLGGPTMNNYFDGRNGLYLYNPKRFGNELGYGPSSLSGTLALSWYSFLGSEAFKSELAETTFPLNPKLLDLYTNPNTERARHVLLAWPNYFTNGWTEMYFLLSEKYPFTP